MKEYKTLTREKVDVVPFGRGMPETHLMQDWSDRMLDLILNGPTINGIKKDEVRAMLRETTRPWQAVREDRPDGLAIHQRPDGHRGPGPSLSSTPASSTSRSTSPTCGTRPTAPPTA